MISLIRLSRFVRSLAASTAAVSLLASFVTAATYNISKGSISDHGNPNTTNSIAWYFKTKGSNHTYNLTTSGTYTIKTGLTVPSGATLKDSTSSTLKAASNLSDKTMIRMSNNSRLYKLNIDGGFHPRTIIWASGKSNVKIDECTVKNTKNNYSSSLNRSVRLIDLGSSSSSRVHRCSLYNAGYPKQNSWSGTGYGVYARNASNIQVQYNSRISHVLSAGVDITNVINSTVRNNTIYETGKNYSAGSGSAADSITGYHHSISDSTKLNMDVLDNYLYDADNHGVHVSGRDLVLDDNTVQDQRQRGLAVWDWRTPGRDWSSEVTFKDNTTETGNGGSSSTQKQPMFIDYYYTGSLTNTGNNSNLTKGSNRRSGNHP